MSKRNVRKRRIDEHGVVHFGSDEIMDLDEGCWLYIDDVEFDGSCDDAPVTCLLCLSVSRFFCNHGLCQALVPVPERYCKAHK